jgi:hypothetical protein
MVNVLRAAYDTVASRIVLHEAYRRRAWAEDQSVVWVADAQRQLIIDDLKTRFRSGEYVLLKRKRQGQENPTLDVGELQVSNPGTTPQTIFGGHQFFYETAAGGFYDPTGPQLITGFQQNGSIKISPTGVQLPDDADEAVQQVPFGRKVQDRLFKKYKREHAGVRRLDAPVTLPLPGMLVALPARVRGVLTSAGELLEHMNQGTERLTWMVSASTVGIGDPAREKSDFINVLQHANAFINGLVEQRNAFCSAWYIEYDVNRSTGTLHPTSASVSEGSLSNGDLVVATVSGTSVHFKVCQQLNGVWEPLAVVTFLPDSNLFEVTVDKAVQGMWNIYRLATHGVEHGEHAFDALSTQCEAIVPHRKSVTYSSLQGVISMMGEAVQATASSGGGVLQVRAWVDDTSIDAVLTTTTDSIVTVRVIEKPTLPRWLSVVDRAVRNDLPGTIGVMETYLRKAEPMPFTPASVRSAPAMLGYTGHVTTIEHYRLVPLKGEDYDYTTTFGQSIHSHHDTFRFSNEPGQWFVGATPSRAIDGLECAVGYLQWTYLK